MSAAEDTDDDWGMGELALSSTKGSKKAKGKDKKEDPRVKRDKDLKHCEAVAGHWLPFSLGKTSWIPLTSNAALREAFQTPCNMKSLESIDEWTTRVQQALCYYVLLEMIMKEDDRVQQFQALGRGWVFVLLESKVLAKYTKMKVWFESSDRVLHDHEMDMRAAELVGATRDKYLWGYNPEAEIVFFIKGLAPARPLVCIQRLRPDYRDLDKWAVKPGAKIKCLNGQLPSDAEREKVVRQHKKRKHRKTKAQMRERLVKADERDAGLAAAALLLRRFHPDECKDLDLAAAAAAKAKDGAAAAATADLDPDADEGSDEGGEEGEGGGGSGGSAGAAKAAAAVAAQAALLRSVQTAYGLGLVRKTRSDGTLVVELQWGLHIALVAPSVAPPGSEPLLLAASHAPPLADAAVLFAKAAGASGGGGGSGGGNGGGGGGSGGGAVLAAGSISGGNGKPAAAAASPARAFLYLPPPYAGVLGAETFGMHERARQRDKDDAAFEDSQDLFAQLLAEAKADQGYSQRAASQQTSKQQLQQQQASLQQQPSKESSWERGDYY
jgi:hypothetical protein